MKVNVQRTNLSDLTLDAISMTAETLADNEAGSVEKIEEMLIALCELGWIDGKESTKDRVDYQIEGNLTEYPDSMLVSSMGDKESRIL